MHDLVNKVRGATGKVGGHGPTGWSGDTQTQSSPPFLVRQAISVALSVVPKQHTKGFCVGTTGLFHCRVCVCDREA